MKLLDHHFSACLPLKRIIRHGAITHSLGIYYLESSQVLINHIRTSPQNGDTLLKQQEQSKINFFIAQGVFFFFCRWFIMDKNTLFLKKAERFSFHESYFSNTYSQQLEPRAKFLGNVSKVESFVRSECISELYGSLPQCLCSRCLFTRRRVVLWLTHC